MDPHHLHFHHLLTPPHVFFYLKHLFCHIFELLLSVIFVLSKSKASSFTKWFWPFENLDIVSFEAEALLYSF